MDKEKTEALLKIAPNLYRSYYGSIRNSCMPFGFECSGGWFESLYELSQKLEEIIVKTFEDKNIVKTSKIFGYPNNLTLEEKNFLVEKHEYNKLNDFDPVNFTYTASINPRKQIYATQVKEKFGTGRFYMSSATVEMWELISDWEKSTRTLCMLCYQTEKIKEDLVND